MPARQQLGWRHGPGSSDLARHLLTDASNWPGLFASPVLVQSVTRHENSAVTELCLTPPLLFGEIHMVVATTEVSRLRLERRLVRGDVLQYAHVWRLTPLAGERRTQAVLEFTMHQNPLP